jgi:hypothetical protein
LPIYRSQSSITISGAPLQKTLIFYNLGFLTALVARLREELNGIENSTKPSASFCAKI